MHIIKYLKTKYYKIKINYFSKKFKRCGTNLIFDYKNSALSFEYISLGNNVYIGTNAWINPHINIGNNVTIGPKVTIIGGDHLFGILGESVKFLKPLNRDNPIKTFIEDEAWIGLNVTIMKSVTIGIRSVIDAASVVTKSIPPYTVAVGNQCKPIKRIFDDANLKIHLEKLEYEKKVINNIILKRLSLLPESFPLSHINL